ncbi:MAG: FAD-dependent oxidoreductase [Acidobacteria bacterium]|nr:FAD-dependent oxidoreductase [Acidobacteriota bacterium]
MFKAPPTNQRELKLERLACDLAVIGGGLAGVCAAITAARDGLKVVLAQDRPILGGNASSEVRLWVLGATSHLGNNNRWAREGGVINEILVENMFRNREGNPLIFDSILLELVANEPNLTLLLNTAVHDLEKTDADTIKTVRAFCSQNSTAYEITAPLFVDASGDGIVGFLAGAAFRIGAEGRAEFDEPFAAEKAANELLGHTIYFYSKDTGRPVKFIPPSFALKDITKIPRWRDIQFNDSGCKLWWLEWGGKLDTIHESEKIKWELWRVAYGVWHHIKNSGQFPAAETLTLEWVGMIPGKRESRRFEGDYMISQRDLIAQRPHADAVSFGGWAIDLHPSDGVYSPQSPCQQWHSKGVYPIPYRTMYSRNIKNLFLAGRIISASHIAFGSTRVMATCAHGGQAVGMAAALCKRHKLNPRDITARPYITELQRELIKLGQYIPGVALEDSANLVKNASLAASSELSLSELKPCGETRELDFARAMMLPVQAGPMPKVTYLVDVSAPTELECELRVSSKADNHTPDVTLKAFTLALKPGARQSIALDFGAVIDEPRYAFVCLMANPHVAIHLSDLRLTGVLAVSQKFNRAVAKTPRQEPPADSGIEAFEFWIPERRPGGKNFACTISPALNTFGVENLTNGFARPVRQPNAWVAAFEDEQPCLKLTWSKPQKISRVELMFDTDYDHPMESVLMGHPERVMPFCVPNVVVLNPRAVRDVRPPQPAAATVKVVGASGYATELLCKNGNSTPEAHPPGLLAQLVDNHETRRVLAFAEPVTTDCLEVHLTAPDELIPAALFEIRCYA